jgi:hypothetical protein
LTVTLVAALKARASVGATLKNAMIGIPTPRTSPSLLSNETCTGRPGAGEVLVLTAGLGVTGGLALELAAGVVEGTAAALLGFETAPALLALLLFVQAARTVARPAPPRSRKERLVVPSFMRSQ